MSEEKATPDKKELGIQTGIIRASRVLLYAGCALLTIMMLLTTGDVLGRYFFNSPIEGTYELVGLFLVLVLAAGLAHCQLEKGNVRVKIIYEKQSEKTRNALDILAWVIGGICSLLICWQLIKIGIEYMQRVHGGLTETLTIPFAPFYIIQGLGFAFLTFIFILDVYAIATKKRKGE